MAGFGLAETLSFYKSMQNDKDHALLEVCLTKLPVKIFLFCFHPCENIVHVSNFVFTLLSDEFIKFGVTLADLPHAATHATIQLNYGIIVNSLSM